MEGLPGAGSDDSIHAAGSNHDLVQILMCQAGMHPHREYARSRAFPRLSGGGDRVPDCRTDIKRVEIQEHPEGASAKPSTPMPT